jgi:hypothetical protein
MSSGIELYDRTPYWTAGARIAESKTDPNAVKSVTEGIVEGVKGL